MVYYLVYLFHKECENKSSLIYGLLLYEFGLLNYKWKKMIEENIKEMNKIDNRLLSDFGKEYFK